MIYTSFPVIELWGFSCCLLVTGPVVSPLWKFTSSYCREMTNDASFMWVIKISKDLFSCFIQRLKDKKTSLNNGWEKGLLRKESQCDAIELSRTWAVDRRDTMSGWDMRKEECLMVWTGVHCFGPQLYTSAPDVQSRSANIVWPAQWPTVSLRMCTHMVLTTSLQLGSFLMTGAHSLLVAETLKQILHIFNILEDKHSYSEKLVV